MRVLACARAVVHWPRKRSVQRQNAGSAREPQAQRLVAQEQRLQHDPDGARRCPGERVPGRDQPGIGEAGLERRLRLAVDHRDLVPVGLQVPGRGHAREAGAQNRDRMSAISRVPQ